MSLSSISRIRFEEDTTKRKQKEKKNTTGMSFPERLWRNQDQRDANSGVPISASDRIYLNPEKNKLILEANAIIEEGISPANNDEARRKALEALDWKLIDLIDRELQNQIVEDV